MEGFCRAAFICGEFPITAPHRAFTVANHLQSIDPGAGRGRGRSDAGFSRIPSIPGLAGDTSMQGLYGLSPHAGSASAMAAVLGLSSRSTGSTSDRPGTGGIDRNNSTRDEQGRLQQGPNSILSGGATPAQIPANGAHCTPGSASQGAHSAVNTLEIERPRQTATTSPTPTLQESLQERVATAAPNAASYLWWFKRAPSLGTDGDPPGGVLRSASGRALQADGIEAPVRDPGQSNQRGGSGRKKGGTSKVGLSGAPGLPVDGMDEEYPVYGSFHSASRSVQRF